MQVVPAVEQSNGDYIARKFSLTVDYLRITETYRDISLTKVCSKLLKKLEVNRCGPLESSIARAYNGESLKICTSSVYPGA